MLLSGSCLAGVNAGPTDVVDGVEKLVMGLVWSIMEFFSVARLHLPEGLSPDTIKTRVVHWLLTHSVPPGKALRPASATCCASMGCI